ncbi:hypothetical protein B0T22DRAFT_536411 [Podospora appendiculata]|uniref:Uncharacterized protein n=1 Tax=Podospora appendiculata TaxID=314037 RepID=A0AAE0XBR2_9PEZI|nr:hypothetical protein B0T22DRAFT_536411 [Podospora appendiculata]
MERTKPRPTMAPLALHDASIMFLISGQASLLGILENARAFPVATASLPTVRRADHGHAPQMLRFQLTGRDVNGGNNRSCEEEEEEEEELYTMDAAALEGAGDKEVQIGLGTGRRARAGDWVSGSIGKADYLCAFLAAQGPRPVAVA